MDALHTFFGTGTWDRAIRKAIDFHSTYFVIGTCHFARKIDTHDSVNSGGF